MSFVSDSLSEHAQSKLGPADSSTRQPIMSINAGTDLHASNTNNDVTYISDGSDGKEVIEFEKATKKRRKSNNISAMSDKDIWGYSDMQIIGAKYYYHLMSEADHIKLEV